MDFEVLRGMAHWARSEASGLGFKLKAYALTILLVGFCAFFRYSDLEKLYADEVHFYEDRVELFLETRKTVARG